MTEEQNTTTLETLATEKPKKKKYSLKGYSFYHWWSDNKELVKSGIAFAVFLAVFFRSDLTTPELSAAVALAAAVAIKKGLDLLDFAKKKRVNHERTTLC